VFGLNDPTLNVFEPFGPPSIEEHLTAGEVTQQAEIAHSIAPEATIDLVLTNPSPNATSASAPIRWKMW
jgi:subtilase family serine protease